MEAWVPIAASSSASSGVPADFFTSDADVCGFAPQPTIDTSPRWMSTSWMRYSV